MKTKSIIEPRTKADLLARIEFLDQRNRQFSAECQVLRMAAEDRTAELEKIRAEVVRLNELVLATTQENNRLTIERNAANALVDRIRVPSQLECSERSISKITEHISSEVIAALLLVKG